MSSDPVEVMAGSCAVEDGELLVRHSPLRAIHPVPLLGSCALLTAGAASLLTDWTYVAEGQPMSSETLLLFAGLTLAIPAFTARRKRLLTDARIPLRDIDHARVETESRRWYLKQERELPVVVVEYVDDGERATYPIHLHGRGAEAERDALLAMLEAQGIRVREKSR